MNGLQEHRDLQALNTLAVPARARYFTEVTDLSALTAALALARDRALPLLLLGGGSNLVLADDFPGLVIRMALRGRELMAEDSDHYYLKVAAGEDWPALVEYCLDKGYWGLENLSLIPGSVGAAPIQNIGAYGVELCQRFDSLEALDRVTGSRHRFSADDCRFGYRDSVFKSDWQDRYVIVSVTLKLRRQPQLVLSYPALQQALADVPDAQLTPRRVADSVCAIRRSKLPDPLQIPNVGSFFKNPVVDEARYRRLMEQYPDMVAFPLGDGRFKLAAGWLIEKAGWKGREKHGVAVHRDQALVLTNSGREPGAKVLALARDIADSLAQIYSVKLEIEPRIYP